MNLAGKAATCYDFETMHVKKITFDKFCGFEKFTVDLAPFTALVGPNNGGKTTILRAIKITTDAVRAVFGGAGHPNVSMWNQPLGVGSDSIARPLGILDLDLLFHRKNRQDGTRITLEFERGKDTYSVIVECIARKNTIRLEMALNNQPIAGLSEDEAHGFVRSLHGMRAQFIPAPGAISASERVLEWGQLQTLLSEGKFGETWRNQLHWLSEGKNPEVFQRVVDRVAQYLPVVGVKYPRRGKTTSTVEIMYEEDGTEYDISASGAGLRTLLSLAAAIELSDARVLLFDEPDSHLHPALQRSVAALLQEAVTENRQIVIATHAPDIIEELPPESLVWIDKTSQCGRSCSDVGKTLVELGAMSHSAAVRFMDVNSLIYVEGRNDQRVLEQILHKCGRGDLLRNIRFELLGGFGDFAHLAGALRLVRARHGVELTIAAILDADYTSVYPRGEAETVDGVMRLRLPCKELENLLLLDPKAIHKALVAEDERRRAHNTEHLVLPTLEQLAERIDEFTSDNGLKNCVRRQWTCVWAKNENADLNQEAEQAKAEREFERRWNSADWRRRCCPGKRVLGRIRAWLQKDCQVSLGLMRIFEHYEPTEELRGLIDKLHDHLTKTTDVTAGRKEP